jgi:hypothetical protein
MKTQINLYQPSCYPKREKATFKQFIIVCVLCAISVTTLVLVLQSQLASLQSRSESHRVMMTEKQSELSQLVVQLQNNRAPEAKVKQQQDLEEEISARQSLLASLSGVELSMTISFSDLMRGLSNADMATMSIEQFSIIDGRLNIIGKAKYSDSVALWLTKAQSTVELSDISFEKMAMEYIDEQALFSFKLINRVENPINEEQTQ